MSTPNFAFRPAALRLAVHAGPGVSAHGDPSYLSASESST